MYSNEFLFLFFFPGVEAQDVVSPRDSGFNWPEHSLVLFSTYDTSLMKKFLQTLKIPWKVILLKDCTCCADENNISQNDANDCMS